MNWFGQHPNQGVNRFPRSVSYTLYICTPPRYTQLSQLYFLILKAAVLPLPCFRLSAYFSDCVSDSIKHYMSHFHIGKLILLHNLMCEAIGL